MSSHVAQNKDPDEESTPDVARRSYVQLFKHSNTHRNHGQSRACVESRDRPSNSRKRGNEDIQRGDAG